MKSFEVTIPVLNEEATLETNVKTLNKNEERFSLSGFNNFGMIYAKGGYLEQ